MRCRCSRRASPASGTPGTYAFELKQTCDGYVINQRMRLEVEGAKGAVVSEQTSQMTESRDGRKLKFEHHSLGQRQATSQLRGDATLDDDGGGQSLFSEPEGQSVALPKGTLFPNAMTRATLQHAKAGDSGFDALFFFGEKVKPPQSGQRGDRPGAQAPRRLQDPARAPRRWPKIAAASITAAPSSTPIPRTRTAARRPTR